MNDVRTQASARMPFDRYQRYALTTRVIGALATRPEVRILEVGAHQHWALERFLPAARIVYLDVDFTDDRDRLGCFVQADAGKPPFRDGTFDAVVALDVLEHVPPQERARFVANLVAMARTAVVLSAPFDDAEVVAEERRLNAFFRDLHGVDFEWLKEHRQCGLPEIETTLADIQATGWSSAVVAHGNLALWARLMQAHLFVNSEPELLELREAADELYNRELFARDWSKPVYRHLVVAAPSAREADVVRGLFADVPGPDAEALLRLQVPLDRLYERGLRRRAHRRRAEIAAAAERERQQTEESERRVADAVARVAELESDVRAREEIIAALAGELSLRDEEAERTSHDMLALSRRLEREEQLRARITRTRSWRLTAPLRAADPALRRTFTLIRWRLHRMHLEPVQDLVVEGEGYRSTGVDPQFRLRSSRRWLPSGWVLVSGEARSEGPWLEPKLYVDSGSRLTEEESIKVPLGRGGHIRTVLRLPHRVLDLRLDPLSAPGTFLLRDLTFRELGLLQVGAAFVRRHLLPLFRDPPRLLNLARRGITVLRTGGPGAVRRRLLALEQARADYEQWVTSYDTITDGDRPLIERQVRELPKRPRISVVMTTYESSAAWLRLAIESVRRQLYPDWELCIADDASRAPHVRQILSDYMARDPRIKVVFRTERGHIAAASNSALEIATGSYVTFLDHDDELAEHALYMVAAEIGAHPDAALFYSDEDKIDELGQRYDPYFKPDWNPDLLLAQNYVAHLCVLRTDLAREIGGLRPGYDGAQDWDLVLRAASSLEPSRIRHIPSILYHWRAVPGSTALASGEKQYVRDAQRRTLESHFERAGQAVQIEPAAGIHWRVRYPIPDPPPLVTLIIPTRDGYRLLHRCVESILRRTRYSNLEILILDNQSTDPRTRSYLRELAMRPDVTVLRYDAPFNFAAINNFAARRARGEILGLVNNDVEVISPDWLDEMVGHALRPEIGAVGAMLYYPNNTIQHAGVILGIGGVAGHAHTYQPRGHPGQACRGLLAQDLSVVTGACMILRRSVYEEVGGLDETHLPIAFNDVDLCLRIRDRGYRIVWTPHAELYHHESASRGYEETPTQQARFEREERFMKERWGQALKVDPAYNPNLALDRETFSLAFPPRVGKPWLPRVPARE
jgi:GT2 family glycosyltransferase